MRPSSIMCARTCAEWAAPPWGHKGDSHSKGDQVTSIHLGNSHGAKKRLKHLCFRVMGT